MNGLSRDWSWVQAHGTALMTVAGAALTVLVLGAIWAVARKRSLGRVMRVVAMPLVLAFEAQGLYVLILRLGPARGLALALCGFSAAAIATFGSLAHEHHKKHGRLGPNGRVMWYVAVPVGLIVALSAGSLAGAALRLFVSVLSVALFRSIYLPDEPEGKKDKQGSWRLTPRRLGVALGLIDPADTDLTTIHAERQVRMLTRHAAGFHRGVKPLRHWHGHRFERLALMADDDMIAEAARRVRRVHTGLASTAPEAVPAGSEAVPEIIPGRLRNEPGGEPESGPEDRLQDEPETGPRDRPEARSEDRREPSLKLAASKSSKMSSDDLAPHVAAMLKAHGDKAVSIARVKADLHVGADKAKEALLIAKRNRVTPIGIAREGTTSR